MTDRNSPMVMRPVRGVFLGTIEIKCLNPRRVSTNHVALRITYMYTKFIQSGDDLVHDSVLAQHNNASP